jgi:DNA-binding response OmpR family regulator
VHVHGRDLAGSVDEVVDRVLLVEDDAAVRTLVRMLLEDEGLKVTEAPTGTAALESFAHGEFDLVLLDLRLPGVNGFDVCREVRRTSDVPIVMVTAQQDSHDVVAGLELGADDYVTKPFNDRELLARVRAQLRRRHGSVAPPRSVDLGDVTIRLDEGTVLRDGEPVALTKTEFNLLHHLVSNPNRVWSRGQLLEHVWGYSFEGDGRVVDTHVARLRTKIEADAAHPTLIQTVRGLGYKLSVPTSR